MEKQFTLTKSLTTRVLPLLAVASLIATLTACSPAASDESIETPKSDSSETSDQPASTDPSAILTQPQLSPQFEVDEDIRALLPQRIQDSGEIAAALSVAVPPINFAGQKPDTVAGLNPDLQNAVAQILGVELKGEIYPTTASQLLGLDSGRVDVVFAATSDTRERQDLYTFLSYYKANYGYVVEGSSLEKFKTWEDLCGGSYGVVGGSTDGYEMLSESCESIGKPAPERSIMEDTPALVLAGMSGRIDTYFAPDALVLFNAANGAVVELMDPPTPINTFYSWAFSNDNDGIAEAMLAALQKLEADGFYAEAFEYWQVPSNMLSPGINIGENSTMFG